MAAYKLAIEQGEITPQQFIQASLILAEAYHEIDTKKSSPHFKPDSFSSMGTHISRVTPG